MRVVIGFCVEVEIGGSSSSERVIFVEEGLCVSSGMASKIHVSGMYRLYGIKAKEYYIKVPFSVLHPINSYEAMRAKRTAFRSYECK